MHARRVKEFLNAHLSGRILLTDLARTCDLSVRQFTRALRQTTGMAPHQWLLRQRIEKAKDLLPPAVHQQRSHIRTLWLVCQAINGDDGSPHGLLDQ